jgi:hypothetical protein
LNPLPSLLNLWTLIRALYLSISVAGSLLTKLLLLLLHVPSTFALLVLGKIACQTTESRLQTKKILILVVADKPRRHRAVPTGSENATETSRHSLAS